MSSFDRRTTGQPICNGLTEAQLRYLAIYLLMPAAAALATLVFAPVGLALIGVISYAIGYLGKSARNLPMNSETMSATEKDIRAFGVLSILAILTLIYGYITGENTWTYYFHILATGAFIHVTAVLIGGYMRACWNGFRI